MHPLRDTWHRVGPWRIHAFATGDPGGTGLPIVLVHGFGVSARYWRRLAGRLGAHHPVHAPDLPGHGPSSRPRRALDLPALAEALTRWMEAAGIPRAMLVGNSMGCQIAAELAAAEPARVDSLVFCGPTVDPAARTAPRQILRLLLSAPAEDPRLAPLLIGDYLRAGARRLLAELEHMLRHPMELRLPGLTMPTLVLRGTWDRVVPRRWAEEAAALLPRGSLVEIPAAGHAAHFTRARATAERILATVPRAPRPAGTPPPARAAREPGAPG